MQHKPTTDLKPVPLIVLALIGAGLWYVIIQVVLWLAA